MSNIREAVETVLTLRPWRTDPDGGMYATTDAADHGGSALWLDRNEVLVALYALAFDAEREAESDGRTGTQSQTAFPRFGEWFYQRNGVSYSLAAPATLGDELEAYVSAAVAFHLGPFQ